MSSSCDAFSLIYSYPYNWRPVLYASINLSNQLANNLSPLKKKNTFSNKAVSINDDLNLHGTVYSPLVGEREDILRAQILDRTITQCPELPAGRGWHWKSSGMEGPKGANEKDDGGLPWPSTAGGVDSIPGRGTEIRHAMLCGRKVRKRRRRSGRTGLLPAESLRPWVAACSPAFFPEMKLRSLFAPCVSLGLTQRHYSDEVFPQAGLTASRALGNKTQAEDSLGGWEEKPMRPLAFSEKGSSDIVPNKRQTEALGQLHLLSGTHCPFTSRSGYPEAQNVAELSPPPNVGSGRAIVHSQDMHKAYALFS